MRKADDGAWGVTRDGCEETREGAREGTRDEAGRGSERRFGDDGRDESRGSKRA